MSSVLAKELAERIAMLMRCSDNELLSVIHEVGVERVRKLLVAKEMPSKQFYIKCPECNGEGTLGKSGDRWIACQRCGGHEDGQGTGFILAAALIDSALPKWVEVEVELPTLDGRYLVMGKYDVFIAQWTCEDGLGNPHTTFAGLLGRNVTHWMPLPAAPSTDSEEK